MIHVYQSRKKWKVRRNGMVRSLRSCLDKTEAMQYAHTICQQTSEELVVHLKDGRVDFRLDYTLDKTS